MIKDKKKLIKIITMIEVVFNSIKSYYNINEDGQVNGFLN